MALAALAAASLASNSAAFVAPCSSSSSFVRRSSAHHASTSSSTATMSLESNNAARVALGTFLAGAALMFSGGEVALADGSTSKFSLPPVAQGKDR